MLGIHGSPEKKLKLVDVKLKGDSFQISCADKNSKWTLRKSIDDILNFHHSIHESFNESCVLCERLTDISSISSTKFKSSHILKFLNFCIEEQTMEYEEFLYPSRCNTAGSISLKTCRSPSDDSLLQPVKSNSLLSVSVSTPKPKYSDELVDELHRIRNQLALNDSIKENGLFMEVKVKRSNYNFVTILSKDSTFEDFIKKIKRKMAVSQDDCLKFMYKDDDNDNVIIEDEGDFRIALNSKLQEMELILEIIEQ